MTKCTYFYSICNEITWKLVSDVLETVYDNILNKQEFTELTLMVATEGGDLEAAWVLYTGLKGLGCPITTIANGRVYSSGVLLTLMGDKRYAFKNSIFLFHPATLSVNRDIDLRLPELEEHVKSLSLERQLFIELIQSKVTNEKFIDKICDKHESHFIGADEAKEMGLVHDIITTIDEV